MNFIVQTFNKVTNIQNKQENNKTNIKWII